MLYAVGVEPATLHFFCGKMAAGKTTRARELARTQHAILLEEDSFLATLFPGAIHSVDDYIECSRRVRAALADHIVALLARGLTVVLDFPANTPRQRQWFRTLIDRSGAAHQLHYLDVPDERCKAQLRQRSAALPPGAPFTSDAEFDAITRYFEPPTAAERFHVVPA